MIFSGKFERLLRGWWPAGKAYHLTATVIGVVLLAAAGLKTHQLATEAMVEHDLWTSRGLLIGVALFEIAFGCWLLTGLYPQRTRYAAMGCFVVFFETSLYLALMGKASCGCLGKLPVNPWLMLFLDLGAIAALLAWRPNAIVRAADTDPWRFKAYLAVSLLIGAPAFITMLSNAPSGIVPSLRHDPDLNRRLDLNLRNPKLKDLFGHVEGATGLKLSHDDRIEASLADGEPDFGEMNLRGAYAWSIMELAAQRQEVPARWEKVQGGYRLIHAAPLFTRAAPWLFSCAFLFLLTVRTFFRRPISTARASRTVVPLIAPSMKVRLR